jgi:hypothetical protein
LIPDETCFDAGAFKVKHSQNTVIYTFTRKDPARTWPELNVVRLDFVRLGPECFIPFSVWNGSFSFVHLHAEAPRYWMDGFQERQLLRPRFQKVILF